MAAIPGTDVKGLTLCFKALFSCARSQAPDVLKPNPIFAEHTYVSLDTYFLDAISMLSCMQSKMSFSWLPPSSGAVSAWQDTRGKPLIKSRSGTRTSLLLNSIQYNPRNTRASQDFFCGGYTTLRKAGDGQACTLEYRSDSSSTKKVNRYREINVMVEYYEYMVYAYELELQHKITI